MPKNVSIEDFKVGDILINPFGFPNSPWPLDARHCVVTGFSDFGGKEHVRLQSLEVSSCQYLSSARSLKNMEGIVKSEEEKAFILLKLENDAQ